MDARARPLSDLIACVNREDHHEISRERRWELCASCRLVQCKPTSPACACREAVAERQRIYYHSDPKAKDRLRVENMTPEQAERRRQRQRDRRAADPEYVKSMRRINYERNAEYYRQKRREFYAANRERLMQEQRARRNAHKEQS